MSPARRRYNLAWRRGNLAALIALCALAGAWLSWRSSGSGRTIGGRLPVRRPRVAAAREKIDPNTATLVSLLRLPGIGPAKAQAIIDFRRATAGLDFRSADDLARVRGIGPGIVQRLGPHLTQADRDWSP